MSNIPFFHSNNPYDLGSFKKTFVDENDPDKLTDILCGYFWYRPLSDADSDNSERIVKLLTDENPLLLKKFEIAVINMIRKYWGALCIGEYDLNESPIPFVIFWTAIGATLRNLQTANYRSGRYLHRESAIVILRELVYEKHSFLEALEKALGENSKYLDQFKYSLLSPEENLILLRREYREGGMNEVSVDILTGYKFLHP